ncbi:hypothetical protein [Pandoraea communis]|uniref:hypothetical protein n=1 Tax=Pandoraea communis TaxID=2508297 RepID=UPI0025A507A5|nr:hypothetical protein [Pandoraea communis]MDM8355903.1 hypothetical protein [Pandoraea communis]
MRLDSNSATTVQHATAPQCPEDADQNAITLDIALPPAPDDVRLNRQTGRRACQPGCSTMLMGLAVTILGLAGVAGGAYFVVDAAATVDDSPVANSQQRAEYSAGGALLGLGVMALSIGLCRVCAGWETRQAMADGTDDVPVGERFEMKGRDAREYA